MPGDNEAMPVLRQGISVTDAIARRQSVRQFTSRPVAESDIRDLLDLAGRSPSGGNLQPWEVHAVAGDVRETLRERVNAKIAAGNRGEETAMNVYPRGLWEPFKSRRHEAGTERYAALGFFDKDPVGLKTLTEMNTAFFGAPVGLFFCISNRMEPHQWCDTGMFMQNVMLLAVERGLDTCPQAFWTNWSATVRDLLSLPAETILIAGMALGYRDEDHAINRYRTARSDLASYAHFHGFADGS